MAILIIQTLKFNQPKMIMVINLNGEDASGNFVAAVFSSLRKKIEEKTAVITNLYECSHTPM